MDKDFVKQLVLSWATTDSRVTPTEEILRWVDKRNRETHVDIRRIPMEEMGSWYYDSDEGVIRNKQGSFFKVSGFRAYEEERIVSEQPILIQPENGYLGIICKELDGVLHFLMQAKIEPGNVNKIQLSPTIQATKSNFTQAHGGKRPEYLDYFRESGKYELVLDQLQSEQSARFLKKRNRNLMIFVREDVPVLPTHRWMTLGQIKELMCTRDNMVNMDTRTVLSCLPFSTLPMEKADREEIRGQFSDPALYRSVFEGNGDFAVPRVYNYLNDYKMFADRRCELIPLHQLSGWHMSEYGVFPDGRGSFQVICCQIEIEGREVVKWTQPLFMATGISTFALVMCEIDGVMHFLVKGNPEPGCFDGIELAPTVQLEPADAERSDIPFLDLLKDGSAQILCDVLLSEEGGRFYHEQNRNLLIQVERDRLGELPPGYFLLDYMTLNRLCQVNNCLNIQLRNLLSLLRIKS